MGTLLFYSEVIIRKETPMELLAHLKSSALLLAAKSVAVFFVNGLIGTHYSLPSVE